jgi:hypothetical protein
VWVWGKRIVVFLSVLVNWFVVFVFVALLVVVESCFYTNVSSHFGHLTGNLRKPYFRKPNNTIVQFLADAFGKIWVFKGYPYILYVQRVKSP